MSNISPYEIPGEAFLLTQSRATSHFISVQPDQMINEPHWNDRLALDISL